MKKLISAVLAAAMLMSFTAVLAQDITVKDESNTKAILLCYNESGKLVHSALLKSADGVFDVKVPDKYDDTTKKIYYIDTQEFKALETEAAEATAAPEATEKPPASATPAPAATAAPSKDLSDTPYENSKDKRLAPAMVVDVETSVNKDGDEVYLLNLFRHGEEISVEIDTDITISTTPDAYKALRGAKLDALERGDMIYYSTNLAGDEVQSLNLIARAPETDIVTGTKDYGSDFEDLVNYGNIMEYGKSVPSSGEYYAFGIVGKTNNNVLTLLNLTGSIDDALEITMSTKAYVYACDVKGKEYTVDITDTHGIETTIPKTAIDKGDLTLDDTYSYDYALVRVVDGTATEIALYNNYND